MLPALRELLDSQDFAAVEHEVGRLEDEYETGHCTSCALRIGRCLEYVVYALARSWAVPIDEHFLDLTTKLRTRLGQLNAAVLQYRDLVGEARQNARRKIQVQTSDFAAVLAQLPFMLDDIEPLKAQRGSGPRNVDAILRDIRREYARLENVRRELDRIQNENLVRRILDKRNDAAHAGLDGTPREVAAEDLENLVDDFNLFLQYMTNVAVEIARTRAQGG